jgi:hypothetical protein
VTAEPVKEADLLPIVLRLFPKRSYRRYVEVPLGRKRVDLHCIPKHSGGTAVCIELKLTDWRRALWQAAHNFHLAERSYIAIWHTSAARIAGVGHLFEHYGVGVIIVGPRSATILMESQDKLPRIARRAKRDFYSSLLEM